MKVELFQSVMGTDLSVVNAARVSFAKASDWDYVCTKGAECVCTDKNPDRCRSAIRQLKPADKNLIQYLARGMSKKEWEAKLEELYFAELDPLENVVTTLMNMSKHWVPFTHTAISLRMQAPVPIRVQCFKHKVGFTESEESRRYIDSRPELYIPDTFRQVAENVKQGSGGTHEYSEQWKETYTYICTEAIDVYTAMIGNGVAPEQARFVLPQGVEVNWIWTGNLASFARYVNQRIDPHAQKESQILAQAVSDIIAPLYPVSWAALVKSGRTE